MDGVGAVQLLLHPGSECREESITDNWMPSCESIYFSSVPDMWNGLW